MTTKLDRTQALSHEGQSGSLYNSVKFDDLRAKFESNKVTETSNSETAKTPQPAQTRNSIDIQESNASSPMPTTVNLHKDETLVRSNNTQVEGMSDESGIVEEPTSSVRETISKIEALSHPSSSKSPSFIDTKSDKVTPTESDKLEEEIITYEVEDLPIKEAVVNHKMTQVSNFATVYANSNEAEINTVIVEEKVDNTEITEDQAESEVELTNQEIQQRESEAEHNPETQLESESKILVADKIVTDNTEFIRNIESTTTESTKTELEQNLESRTVFTSKITTVTPSKLISNTDLVKEGFEVQNLNLIIPNIV